LIDAARRGPVLSFAPDNSARLRLKNAFAAPAGRGLQGVHIKARGLENMLGEGPAITFFLGNAGDQFKQSLNLSHGRLLLWWM
jgi:hypothetical protein